jgi:hypothetical protein
MTHQQPTSSSASSLCRSSDVVQVHLELLVPGWISFIGGKDMKISSLFLAAVLSVGLVATTQAKTTDLGTLAAGTTQYFFDAGLQDHFTDYINFDLASAASLKDGFVFAPKIGGLTKVKDFSLTLQSLESSTWIDLATLGTGPGTFKGLTYSFANLLPGSYRLVLDGIGSGHFGGGYIGGLSVAAAVPEASTWAMLMVGFGLVAYQLRRKQKTLEQQLLA